LRPQAETPAPTAAPRRPRRALVFGDRRAGLRARLERAGFEVRAAAPERAGRAANEAAPDLVLVALGADGDGLTTAAELRAAPATHALPLVLLYETTDEAQRRAALRLGADDYFALAAPDAELRARLAALLWRVEAGRRAAALDASAVSAEIDDFMRLLEAVRADIEAGAPGALALLAATNDDASARALAAAHEFFRLHLRRLDQVAFYGPTLLAVYLPRKGPGTASSTLARLRNEFVAARPDCRLLVGLATFPADGRTVELLIERAEAALEQTRTTSPPAEHESAADETATAKAVAHETIVNETAARVTVTNEITASETAATSESETTTASPASSRAREVEADAPEVAPAPAGEPAHYQVAADRRRARPVRESKQADAFEASVLPVPPGVQYGATHALARAALEAAAREREQRARGATMPRRLLLAVSDAARMAQVNLLLRSAGYEVRAASDAHQALNLLRIARVDLFVLDFDLHGLDGLATLRRLRQQHQGALPLPVVLLLPTAAQREEVRAEARRLGARGFVELPYDPAVLLAAVRTTTGAE
jgi:DNA-binding response OmpR family regulator